MHKNPFGLPVAVALIFAMASIAGYIAFMRTYAGIANMRVPGQICYGVPDTPLYRAFGAQNRVLVFQDPDSFR